MRLILVVPLSLLIIFFLLYASFGSIAQCLLIFTAVPLAAVGGIASLAIRGMPFSISAGVGFIALFGVAVLNGIVFIAYLNQLKAEGVADKRKRILSAAHDRFRPVLITALVASIGFLPMAFSHGVGAEVQRPLATVVIGGLISSTLLTLIVLPVLYDWSGRLRGKKKGPGPLILLMCMLGASQLHAQEQAFPTMEQYIDSALKNHPISAISDQRIKQKKQFQKSTLMLPPLEALFESPTGIDFRPALLQRFDFPVVYGAQYKLGKESVKLAERERSISLAQLVKQVKDAYCQLMYAGALCDELLLQDSLYGRFFEAAQLRFEKGDINKLEYMNAEASHYLVQTQLTQANAQRQNAQAQLQLLSGVQSVAQVRAVQRFKVKDSLQIEATATEDMPFLAYYRQYTAWNLQAYRLSKWQLAPGLLLGYFNQGDPHEDEKWKWQYGVHIPLFFSGHLASIREKRIAYEISLNDYRNANIELNQKLQQAVAEFRANKKSINYFETLALAQSEEMLKLAEVSYQTGSAGYMNYILSLERVFRIRLAYLEALRNYNGSVNQVNYLKGATK